MLRWRQPPQQGHQTNIADDVAKACRNVMARSQANAHAFCRWLDYKRVTPTAHGPFKQPSALEAVPVIPNSGIAAQIYLKSKATWQESDAFTRTQDYVDQISATTYTSVDGDDHSTPSHHSDSGISTGLTSQDGNQVLGQVVEDLKKALNHKTYENSRLQDRYELSRTELREVNQRYATLEGKYTEQRDQRLNDYQKLTEAFDQAQAVEEYCDELEENLKSMQNQRDEIEKELRHELSVKEEMITQLKNPENGVIATIIDGHKKELMAKDVEVEQAMALVKEKEEEQVQAINKAHEERSQCEEKARSKFQKLLKDSYTSRKAMAAEKERLETKIHVLEADFMEADAENQATIKRIVKEKDQLTKEHARISEMLVTKFPRVSKLGEIFCNAKDRRKEMNKILAENETLKRVNVDLLDRIQQKGDHLHRHQEDARNARLDAAGLETKVHGLEAKLCSQRSQIQDATKQIEELQNGEITAGTHCATLDEITFENDSLRELLNTERVAKEEVQQRNVKLDSENLEMAMTQATMEEEFNTLKRQVRDHNKYHDAVMEELEAYRGVDFQKGRFSWNIADLFAQIRQNTDETKAVRDHNTQLEEENRSLRQVSESIAEKKDIAIRNAQKEADFYCNAYYDEAISVTTRLREELHALKVEKGEAEYIEPTPERNPEVAERNVLRVAALCGVQGIDKSLLPSAFFDQNFIADGFPVTWEALRILRPRGYGLVWNAGKIWLKPGFNKLTENEARHMNHHDNVKGSADANGMPTSNDDNSAALQTRTRVVRRYQTPAVPRPPHYQSCFQPHFAESLYLQLNFGQRWELIEEHMPERKAEFEEAAAIAEFEDDPEIF